MNNFYYYFSFIKLNTKNGCWTRIGNEKLAIEPHAMIGEFER
jgi:hypothetical protein